MPPRRTLLFAFATSTTLPCLFPPLPPFRIASSTPAHQLRALSSTPVRTTHTYPYSYAYTHHSPDVRSSRFTLLLPIVLFNPHSAAPIYGAAKIYPYNLPCHAAPSPV